MSKKCLKILIGVALMIFMCITVFANGEIKVAIDGEYIRFDVPPQAVNGRTMVPLRAIFEELGAEVDWDNDTQTVIAQKDGVGVTATLGETAMYVDGTKKEMDVAPMAVDGRILVPVRFVAEAFDCEVEWDENENIVFIATYADEVYAVQE